MSKQNYSQFILFPLMQPNLFRFDVTSCNCLLFTVFDEDDIFSNIFRMTSFKGTFLQWARCFYIFWFGINNYQLILFLEKSILFDLYQMVNIRIYVNNSLNNGRIKYKYKYSSAQWFNHAFNAIHLNVLIFLIIYFYSTFHSQNYKLLSLNSISCFVVLFIHIH